MFPDLMVDVIVADGPLDQGDFDERVVGRYGLIAEALEERPMLDLLGAKAAGQRAQDQRQPRSRHRPFSLSTMEFGRGGP